MYTVHYTAEPWLLHNQVPVISVCVGAGGGGGGGVQSVRPLFFFKGGGGWGSKRISKLNHFLKAGDV